MQYFIVTSNYQYLFTSFQSILSLFNIKYAMAAFQANIIRIPSNNVNENVIKKKNQPKTLFSEQNKEREIEKKQAL